MLKVVSQEVGHTSVKPKFAIVSFSDRPELSSITWPSLRSLSAAYPGRYELFLSNEDLVFKEGFHPSWNKIKMVHRLLQHGHPQWHYFFDAVISIGDDIVITNVNRDALYFAMLKHLFCGRCTKSIIATRDPLRKTTDFWSSFAQFHVNADLLIFKQNSESLQFIDELWEIASQPRLFPEGVVKDIRWGGQLENDAIYLHFAKHGNRSWAIVDHTNLQTFIRPGLTQWWPGHFAAHFMGFSGKVSFAKHFAHYLGFTKPWEHDIEAIFWVGCYSDDSDHEFKVNISRHGETFDSLSCFRKCYYYPYMALQGGQCSCGSGYATASHYSQLPDEHCGPICSGEQDVSPARRCGERFANAVYYLYNGLSVHGNAGGKTTDMYWVGCFYDDRNRNLKFGPQRTGFTTTTCFSACIAVEPSPSFKYMSLQNDGYCSCGDLYMTAPHYSPLPDTSCAPVCEGEEGLSPKRYCGGQWKAAIYFLGKEQNRFL